MLIDTLNRVEPLKFLSIQQIRDHCRITDISSVSDDTLELYLSSAMEAAEDYTGRLWFQTAEITESIKSRDVVSLFGIQRPRRIDVTFKPIEPVFLLKSGIQTTFIQNPSLDKYFILPTYMDHYGDRSNCCDPCGSASDSSLSVQYRAGEYKTGCEQFPPGIKLGALKMIAWLIENPGDELNFVESPAGRSVGVGGNLLKGTNNAAYASGALEEWRRYRISNAV